MHPVKLIHQPLPSGMIRKWSTKPADHKAARLRSNQRRHRERVRCHIAELETRLGETQVRLEKALVHITDLSNELLLAKIHPTRLSDSTQLDGEGTSNNVAVTRDVTRSSPDTSCCVSCPVRESDSIPGDQNRPPPPVYQESGGPVLQTRLFAEESISQEDSAWSSSSILSATYNTSDTMSLVPTLNYDAIAETGEQGCFDLAPPSPGKSTTRCRDAYIIIAQQNYRWLEISAIRRWLEPGFRGALVEGDGCRVETDLLFALLDFVSSS